MYSRTNNRRGGAQVVQLDDKQHFLCGDSPAKVVNLLQDDPSLTEWNRKPLLNICNAITDTAMHVMLVGLIPLERRMQVSTLVIYELKPAVTY